MTNQSEQVKRQAVKSVKWAFVGNLLPKVIQPLFTVALARLLTPADYGIIGIATLVIGLAKMLESMGLNQALIQTDEDIEKAADVVFWSNLLLSGLLYAVVFLTAPLMANFFAEPRVTLVLRVMGLQLVLSAFDDVQEALLRRDFLFRQLVGRRLLPSLMPGLVGIPLALVGFGYWSLVAGTLSGTALGVIFLWKVSRWRPRFRFDLKIARLLLGFGALVMVESLQGWGLSYGDNLVVGRFLGTENLGRYVFGVSIIMLLMGFGITPLSNVVYSAFCRLRAQTKELQRLFIDSTRMLAVIVIPISLGLCLIATPLVSVVFGDKWLDAEPVIRILAIMPGLGWIIAFNPSLYRAMGRPGIMPKFNLAQMVYIVPAYVIGAQFGLIVFCMVRASVGVVFYVPHIWVSIKLLKLPRGYFWDCIRSSLFAGLIMGGLVFALVSLLGPYNDGDWRGWMKLVTIFFSGVVSYGSVLWIINRALCKRFLALTKKFVR